MSLQTGQGIAALLNGRAKRVTPKVARVLQEVLPDALVLVSHDLVEAREHAARIAAAKPDVVLSGGGDGAVVKLLNLLRERGPMPAVGILKLGTGNGWARASGAPDFFDLARKLPAMRRELPTQTYDLVEVDGQLCHFAGVGWDARILNDYSRNLGKRGSQALGSQLATWLNKSALGYLYSTARITVPEEIRELRAHGQPRVVLENLGETVWELDRRGKPLLVLDADGGGPPRILYDGPLSVGAASSTPQWGYGFKAFPFARARPGHINLRIYDRPVLEAVRRAVSLWTGKFPLPGMTDFFVKRARMRFSRPMPFQIGGDPVGLRDEIVFSVASEQARVVDWHAALAQ